MFHAFLLGLGLVEMIYRSLSGAEDVAYEMYLVVLTYLPT